MAAIPARLGRYRLLQHIASGGMADVFRAKSVGIAGFEKILAIKLIRPNIAQEPRFIRSFIDEARIAVSLNHRNIVQVFDFGQAEARLFLAMELIEGIDLRTALLASAEAGYEMPLPIACYIVSDLGAGLDYAHRKADSEGRALGIVHCDVSPHNVMLSYEGFIKILDFGVARARFAMTPEERRLRGKPRYMAPEQTRGETPSPATDSFALGIIAWELFTGLPLFEGADLKQVLRAVRRADVPPVHELNPDVPRYLSDAVNAALAPGPMQRINVGELSDESARATRELATVSSSRALADWLALIRPTSDTMPRSSDPDPAIAPTADVAVVDLAGEPRPDEMPAGTRTNIIVSDELAGESDNRAPDTGTADGLGDDDDDGDDEPSQPFAGTSSSGVSELTHDTARIANKLLRERRHVVATCALIDGASDELRTEIARQLAELAYKRGAVVQTQTPDAVVCVFGLEVAGEDDVAGAMQYSIDATEIGREAAASGEAGEARDLTLRLGTRAGVVARRRGDVMHILGSGLDDARALARRAEPGRPLLSGGAGRLASAQYAFRELPSRSRGSRKLRAFELIGPRSFEERARVLTERRGRFIGRRMELAKISELFERAVAERRRHAVALVGGGGVGKSRLVAELVARHSGVSLVAVAANQASSHAPFSVVTELIQTSLGLPPGRGQQARGLLARRLRGLLESVGLQRVNIDTCAGTIEQAMELRDGALIRSAQATADLRERVAAALRRFRAAAARGPRLTVIENLHLIDSASLDVFRKLAAAPEAAGAELVLMTARPTPELAALAKSVNLILAIDELDAEEREALIRDRLDDDATDEAVALVATRAGGNPLLIEEVCIAVCELGPEEIPRSARDIVLARVNALPVTVRTALQHASVAGPSVQSPILEELLGPLTIDYVGELIEERLLIPGDYAAERGDATELRFRHGLLQEVVYESLSPTARESAHRMLGELLAARAAAGRDERPGEVAHHLELGGCPEPAARFYCRAGDLALAANDSRAARDYYTRTLSLLDALDGVAELRIAGLLGRERAAGLVGDHAAQAEDQEALVGLVADDPALEAEIQWRIARRLLRTADYAAAITAAEAAERAAAAASDERLEAEALLVRGEVYERTGDYVRGLNVVSEATEIFRRVGDRAAEMRSLVVRGRNCLTRSRYRAARDAYEPVLELLAREPDPFLERMVRNHLAVIDLCCGNFERAMASAERSVALCQELGDRARVGDNLSVCGIILSAVGRFDEAKALLDRGLEILEDTQSRWSSVDCRLYRGACATRLGEVNAGIGELVASVAQARELGARYVLANALTELAGALLRRDQAGDVARAEEAAREAHEIAREASLVGVEVLALARHAEATIRVGNTISAIALSTRAVDLLKEQEGIEGPEEEVLYTHCQLLRRKGDERAEQYLTRAREIIESKLERMTRDDWRQSFRENLPVNAAILLES